MKIWLKAFTPTHFEGVDPFEERSIGPFEDDEDIEYNSLDQPSRQ